MKVVIVGDGKVGMMLTQMLDEDHDVTVVDSDPKVLERMQDACDAQAVQGHGATREVLKQAEADSSDLLIAATSSDEINLLSCLIAKKIGCKSTIARVRNFEYADDIVLLREEMGLSLVVNPDVICAREVYRILQLPAFLGRERFAGGRVEIVRICVAQDSPLVGLALKDLHRTTRVGVLVCAASRGDEAIIPGGSFVIQAGDDLYITASTEDLATLIRNLRIGQRKTTQVTIVGGSRMAVYLALRLLRSGVGVKIIERDPERCEILADLLPGADIVEGDGTERDIIEAEGVAHSDALVALTGIDEENLVLAMYMRHLGMQRIITKCNRSQYNEMFRGMGVDTVVSPKASCAYEIASYVRAMENSTGSKMVALHPMADGKVSAMEFIAEAGSATLDTPLHKLPIRGDVLVASLGRGRKVIIPGGESLIRAGDSVVIVSTDEDILDLDEILEG